MDNMSRISSVATEPHMPCKILIIHSEGNINNNPNLSGLVEILCENGYFVDIASPLRKELVQKSPHPHARMILVDNPSASVAGEFTLLAGKPLSSSQQIADAVKGIERYDFIFGVDQSIIEASLIARVRQIPYGLISYEIFFEEETSRDFKNPEIVASKNIALAVCQDAVRAAQLARENQIPIDKIILIPVAGRGCVGRNKSYALHDKLGIEHHKKIAINSGSLNDYCMIHELCQSAAAWPQDWALVLHNRYGLDENTRSYRKQYSGCKKICFSCDPVETPNQMHTLLNSADIGIALYKSIPGKWTGNNIRHIGLASGKIATYLQHGLPILINEIGAMSDYVRQYQLGKVHTGSLPIQIADVDAGLAKWSANTHRFFSDFLDLNKTSQPLLQKLEQLCTRPNPIRITTSQVREANNETAPKSSMTLATSLAPKNIPIQQQCVDSWLNAGFDVVSVNNPDEISQLQPYFKGVRFIPAHRNGLKFYKKPLIFINDLLAALEGTQSDIVGIVNSDIQLRISSDQKERISQLAKDSLVCVNRTNINQADAAEGSPFIYGFDAFFFHRNIIDRLDSSLFCLGVCWWDYYLPLVALLKQVPLSRWDENIAFHVNHETNWDVEQWIRAGRYFFEKILDICKSLEGVHPLSKFHEKFKGSLDFLQKVLDKKSAQPSDIEKIYTMAEFILGFLFGNMKMIAGSPVQSQALHPGVNTPSIEISDLKDFRSPRTQDDTIDVSIILGTKNRAKLLGPMLDSLKDAVDGIRYELIVIEGNSSDNTSEILRKYNLPIIYNEEQCLGPGKHTWAQLYNFGFSKARGKWGMYGSDDIIYGKGCLSRAVEFLNRQKDDIAGGIFYYKNKTVTEAGWEQYGIDFTNGPKLLMNYGLLRMDDFRRIGLINEAYQFYCGDTDLCYKLYESGKQLIPVPDCFILHDNLMDLQKKYNMQVAQNDIKIYKQLWQHFVSMETPKPRRLLWQEDYRDALSVPGLLQRVDMGIEYIWHGIACLQQKMHQEAMLHFQQAIVAQCSHWIVQWYLAKAAAECGDRAIAQSAAETVLRQSPDFKPAKDLLNQIAPVSHRKAAAPKPPRVSIFMSMYNTAQYLPETLDSLISQTFTDWELIIVDDGSADNSLEVARKYQTRDSRIRVSGIPHVGVVKARNEALRQCHPEAVYLMNHDSDDISLPDKLRRLVEYLDTHPDIAVVGCFARYFGDVVKGREQPHLEWQPEAIRQTFAEFNSMIHSASMMRRIVVNTVGQYRHEFPAAEDYDFFARALMAGLECANIPEVLHQIRLHRQSLCAVGSETMKVCSQRVSDSYRRYLQNSGQSRLVSCGAVSTTESVNAIQPRSRQLVQGPARTVSDVAVFRPSNESPLSILHTVEFYAPHTGGAEEVIRQISDRLVKRGHRVTVATTKLAQRNFKELNGVEIKEFEVAGNYAKGFQGKDVNAFVELTGSTQFDVMFNYAAQQWATDLAFISLESTAGKRVNVIAPCGYSALSDAKTLRLPQFEKYFTKIIPAYLPRYDAAVYHSDLYKDYEYAVNHGFSNSIVIPNGTCEDEFSGRSNVNFRQKYGITTKYMALCVANFYPGKGHPAVIEAVRQMNRPDLTLVFIGKEGQLLSELQQQAAGLNIRFCVDIPRQDTVAAYHDADVFLFGSEVEASPLVIIEAKASRTPFVSTDVGNVRQWQGGIVCSPQAMAHHANILLDNEPLRKKLAQEGWQEWKDKLTWESVVDRYEQLYLSLQRARQRGTR